MKNLLCSLTIFLLLMVSAANADFKIPDYTKVTLDNGLTLYLMEQHEVPLVDAILITNAGAVHDGANYGLATFTGEALSFGSGERTKNEIEDLFDFYGANFASGVSSESTSLSLSIASKDSQKLLPIFRDIITKPQFDRSEFNKEKKRYVDQLKQAREQPNRIIRSAFNKLYYQNHPYGNPTNGDIKSVTNLSIPQVKKFYSERFLPNNSALIIVGDFEQKTMMTLVSELFSKWQSKPVANLDLSVFNPPTQDNVWLINKEDAIETTFMFGGSGIASSHSDSVASQVINTILGGRFTSWLNDELRVNSGLTYGARSRFASNAQFGTFYVSTFTKKETTFEALDLALKTYQRIWKKGIDKKTLDSAKAYVKGQFPPRYETSSQLARLLAKMWSLKLNDSFINNFEKNVDSLTVNKANKIAKELLPKDKLQFVLIGKIDELREKAKNYGKIKESDIKTFEF